VSRRRAVTVGPAARSPHRGPGRAEIFFLRAGTGRNRPWIKISAREAEKYINPTKILIIFPIWKKIQFELLIDRKVSWNLY
jgi:hypothetical protein